MIFQGSKFMNKKVTDVGIETFREAMLEQTMYDYRKARTILYGIESGKISLNESSRRYSIEKCNREIDEIKQFLIDDDYDLLSDIDSERFIQAMGERFEINKDVFLESFIKKLERKKKKKNVS